jgi:hypothetical protein
MRSGDFPPSSIVTALRVLEASRITVFPVEAEPVKDTWWLIGWFVGWRGDTKTERGKSSTAGALYLCNIGVRGELFTDSPAA